MKNSKEKHCNTKFNENLITLRFNNKAHKAIEILT